MRSGHPPRYTVQVLLARAVRLDPAAIHARLRTWRDDVELIGGGTEQVTLAIPTNDLPLLVNVYHSAPDTYAAALREALTWSPVWRERHEAVLRCKASIIVAMTAHRPLNHASMLLAFLSVLDTVLFTMDDADRHSAVLHWLPAKQVMAVDRYRMLRTELGPCGPAVNVRIASSGGRPGELLADTVGLAVLGLPDLQTVFTGRDPADVAMQLLVLARRMFVGDRLEVTWTEESAFVPPPRDALTLQLE
jgi:hypothetical protein